MNRELIELFSYYINYLQGAGPFHSTGDTDVSFCVSWRKKAVDSGEKAQQETHCVAEHDSMMYWPQYGTDGWWEGGNTRTLIETLVEFSAYRPDPLLGGG